MRSDATAGDGPGGNAQPAAVPPETASVRTVLFLCTHNSARSQMAEGFVNAVCQGWRAESAGTQPGTVHPLAIQVMAEIGIDISNHRSKDMEEFRGREFDLVATTCADAREACPFFPGKRLIHKSFDDPSSHPGTGEQRLDAFRRVRDEIAVWVKTELGCR